MLRVYTSVTPSTERKQECSLALGVEAKIKRDHMNEAFSTVSSGYTVLRVYLCVRKHGVTAAERSCWVSHRRCPLIFSRVGKPMPTAGRMVRLIRIKECPLATEVAANEGHEVTGWVQTRRGRDLWGTARREEVRGTVLGGGRPEPRLRNSMASACCTPRVTPSDCDGLESQG